MRALRNTLRLDGVDKMMLLASDVALNIIGIHRYTIPQQSHPWPSVFLMFFFIWNLFSSWCDVLPLIPSCKEEFLLCIKASSIGKKRNKLFLIYGLWFIWNAINSLVFNNMRCSPLRTANDIQLVDFNWIKHKSFFKYGSWFDPCMFPLNACIL